MARAMPGDGDLVLLEEELAVERKAEDVPHW